MTHEERLALLDEQEIIEANVASMKRAGAPWESTVGMHYRIGQIGGIIARSLGPPPTPEQRAAMSALADQIGAHVRDLTDPIDPITFSGEFEVP